MDSSIQLKQQAVAVVARAFAKAPENAEPLLAALCGLMNVPVPGPDIVSSDAVATRAAAVAAGQRLPDALGQTIDATALATFAVVAPFDAAFAREMLTNAAVPAQDKLYTLAEAKAAAAPTAVPVTRDAPASSAQSHEHAVPDARMLYNREPAFVARARNTDDPMVSFLTTLTAPMKVRLDRARDATAVPVTNDEHSADQEKKKADALASLPSRLRAQRQLEEWMNAVGYEDFVRWPVDRPVKIVLLVNRVKSEILEPCAHDLVKRLRDAPRPSAQELDISIEHSFDLLDMPHDIKRFMARQKANREPCYDAIVAIACYDAVMMDKYQLAFTIASSALGQLHIQSDSPIVYMLWDEKRVMDPSKWARRILRAALLK